MNKNLTTLKYKMAKKFRIWHNDADLTKTGSGSTTLGSM
jgi:hypothetical protein